MLKKVWLVKGDLVEYCKNNCNDDCDWNLKTHILFECESRETAMQYARDIEDGKYPDIDACNLVIDYKIISVEEKPKKQQTDLFISTARNMTFFRR